MRRIQLLFVLLTMVITMYGQQDTVRKYLDNNLCLAPKKKMAYNALVVRNGNHWLLLGLRPDTTLMFKISFRDAALTIKDGYYALYYPGGKIEEEGYFTGNVPTGQWQSWYRNGQLQDSGSVDANHFTGLWKHWHDNGQLGILHEYRPTSPTAIAARAQPPNTCSIIAFTNITGIAEGPYQSWYENGVQESAGAFQNDTMTGTWKWFRENGKPGTVETYADGKITLLECYDEKGVYSGSSCYIAKPAVFIDAALDEKGYLAREIAKLNYIRWKPKSLNIAFNVTKTGKVNNIIVRDQVEADFYIALLRVISHMPGWSPAISHNRAMDYPVEIYVPRSSLWKFPKLGFTFTSPDSY